MARRWREIARGVVLAAIAGAGVLANTRLESPPRFDEAGYAVLGRALAAGEGYREIGHPERPRHAHFPPGYPLALAGLWGVTGVSVAAAHGLSAACTALVVVLFWRWFGRLYPAGVAWALGLALACNWRWQRDGGAIRSEPLFCLWTALVLPASGRAARRPGTASGVVVGLLLGAAVLTRQVGIGLVAACAADLGSRRGGRATAIAALGACALLVAPWVGWQREVGRGTQVELVRRSGLAALVAGQALFYARRIPDQIVGPLVEVGTVFRPGWAVPVTLGALVGTGVVGLGWMRCLRSGRRRLAGLVPLATLGLLLLWPFTEAGRFLVPLVPFLLIGALEGLAAAGARLGLRAARRRAAWLLVMAAVPYSAYSAWSDRAGAALRAHRDFDAACAWIARHGMRTGPVLTRYPAEVFWQTARKSVEPPGSEDPGAIDRVVERFCVAYILVDEGRFARAARDPLARYAAARAGLLTKRWGSGGAAVYEVHLSKEGRVMSHE